MYLIYKITLFFPRLIGGTSEFDIDLNFSGS